jgi:hypothetical protein
MNDTKWREAIAEHYGYLRVYHGTGMVGVASVFALRKLRHDFRRDDQTE